MKSWELFLQKLDKELGRETVDRWLRSLKVIRFDAANLYLEAKDSFQALWFDEHIAKRVKNELHANGRKIKVHLSTIGALQKVKKKKKSEEQTFSYDPDPITGSFTSWISSENNRLAQKVLQKIDVDAFNPYFLFGPNGSGKTHLLTAAANVLKEKGQNVHYVRAETFTSHVVHAIRSGDMDTFRNAYRKIDALLVDDIEIFGGKAATQEEFFHTFNALHSTGKPILLSAAKSPRELEGIEERLISRFEWGISLPLHPLKDLSHFLSLKLANAPFKIHPIAITFLQEELSSTTSLSKAVETLIYHSQLRSVTHYDLSDVKNVLRHILLEERMARIGPSAVIAAVAKYFGKSAQEITGKGQTKETVIPRHVAMYFLRKKLALSYTKIGSLMKRDHSTVMSSVKHIEASLEKREEEISSAVKTLHQILMNGSPGLGC